MAGAAAIIAEQQHEIEKLRAELSLANAALIFLGAGKKCDTCECNQSRDEYSCGNNLTGSCGSTYAYCAKKRAVKEDVLEKYGAAIHNLERHEKRRPLLEAKDD